MSTPTPSTDADPLALKRIQEETKILQANLDYYKLTVQAEQERLKAELDKVKLEADRQKAEADKIKALLPSGSTKPLSGETKTDEKFGYLAKLAVHEAIRAAAHEIAAQIKGPARVVFVDTLDFCGDDFQALQVAIQIKALHDAMSDQCGEIEKLLASMEPEGQVGHEVLPAAAALPVLSQVLSGVPGMISWAADIAAYFQPEDTYKSVDVTVPLIALQSCVADALKSDAGVTPFFPQFHTFGRLADLPILHSLAGAGSARRELSGRAARLKVSIDKLTKAQVDQPSPENAALLKVAEAAHGTAQTLLQAHDDFSKQMTTVPDGKTSSPLARVATRSYLKGEDGNTELLYLNVVSSGGEVSIRKWLWWTRDIVFLGGCVVTYLLADLEGRTLAAGTVTKMAQTRYGRGQKTAVQFENLIRS